MGPLNGSSNSEPRRACVLFLHLVFFCFLKRFPSTKKVTNGLSLSPSINCLILFTRAASLATFVLSRNVRPLTCLNGAEGGVAWSGWNPHFCQLKMEKFLAGKVKEEYVGGAEIQLLLKGFNACFSILDWRGVRSHWFSNPKITALLERSCLALCLKPLPFS